MPFDYFVIEPFTIFVDYNKSIEEMFSEGKYDKVPKDIKSKISSFEKQGVVETKVNLIKFGSCLFSREILDTFNQYNLRSANAPELLAFGAKYPHMQKYRPIVAINYLWQISLNNIVIDKAYGFKILRTIVAEKFNGKWPCHIKFLAACK